jgi:hypothetical protein
MEDPICLKEPQEMQNELFYITNGGLPIESGTLVNVDLDPKYLVSCWEI